MDRIKAVFTQCQDNRITLSNSKHQIGSEVKFASHLIFDKGTKPDPDKIAAIKEFPESTNVTDLRSFLGLANKFGDYSPDLRHSMEPFKGLLQKKNA